MQVLEDTGLHVKKPMILHVDCKGALDLTYGWNISGLMEHISVWACFLHDLKEANLVLCVWLPTHNTWRTCTPKMCHHNYTIVINALLCMMTMIMTMSAVNIFTRYWTPHT